MGTGVLVGINVVVGLGRGLGVLLATGVDVLIGVALLIGVTVAKGGFDPPEEDCPPDDCVAPVMGTNTNTPGVVAVIEPETMAGGVAVGKAVEDGIAVAEAGTSGEFVGVKKRRANASRVMARSRGVGVGVYLGVRTISGRVSNLSPDITNGI